MSNPTSTSTAAERVHNPWFYATKPTRGTLFLRTFLPWQVVRFIAINLKMVSMIRMSHRNQLH